MPPSATDEATDAIPFAAPSANFTMNINTMIIMSIVGMRFVVTASGAVGSMTLSPKREDSNRIIIITLAR